MTDEEIQAADLIFKHSSTQHDTMWNEINQAMRAMGYDIVNVSNASKFLGEDGYLTHIHGATTLTTKGLQFQRSGKSFGDLLKAIEQKKETQTRKDEMDLRHKELQIVDLEEKIKTLNKEQLKFWRRQKWQFWLTVILGLLSLYNFFFK